MNGAREACEGKENCRSQVKVACHCVNQIIFLCQGCLTDHVLENRPHMFLNLDQAREFLRSSISEIKEDMHGKYLKIEWDVLSYIHKLKSFKARIFTFKQEILEEIETLVQTHIEKVDSLLDCAYLKLNDINKRTRGYFIPDSEILQSYESRGIQGLIEDFLEDFHLKEDEVKEAIQQMISIETSSIPQHKKKLQLNLKQQTDDIEPYIKVERARGKSQVSVFNRDTDCSKKDLLTPDTISKMKSLSSLNLDAEKETDSRVSLPSPYLERPNKGLLSPVHLPRRSLTDLFEEIKKEADLSQSRPFPTQEEPEETPVLNLRNPKLHSRQVLRSIFTAKRGTKDIASFDVELFNITKHKLNSAFSNPFTYSAICILPDDTILIAGGGSCPNWIGDTYKVDVSKDSPICIKLGDLNYPRQQSKMICCGDYVYILGGYKASYSDKAERMKIGESGWNILPDMKQARVSFGVYIEGDRIYLIGGLNATSIEYYDTHMNCFNLLPNIMLPSYGTVCGVIDNKIYVVGQHLRVFSKDFQVLESQDHIHNRNPNCYSNVIVRGYKMFYIDSANSKVYSFDARTKSVTEVKEF